MRRRATKLLGMLSLLASAASAQVIEFDIEQVEPARPEGWALRYASAVTVFGGFGVPDEVTPGTIFVGGELGDVPSVSTDKTRVGFNGGKFEDLNKAPVFGRLRLWYGLPWELTAELGWTPPLTLDGLRADHLFVAGIGRPLLHRERWRVGLRAYLQDGSVRGDITCANEVVAAGTGNPQLNPFACRAPSDDDVDLDQYGIEISGAVALRERFEGFAAVAATRVEPQVQVDAEVFGDVRDRSIVRTDDTLATYTLGLAYRNDSWEALLSAAYTPLDVRRPPDPGLQSDDLLSVRAMLRFHLR